MEVTLKFSRSAVRVLNPSINKYSLFHICAPRRVFTKLFQEKSSRIDFPPILKFFFTLRNLDSCVSSALSPHLICITTSSLYFYFQQDSKHLIVAIWHFIAPLLLRNLIIFYKSMLSGLRISKCKKKSTVSKQSMQI